MAVVMEIRTRNGGLVRVMDDCLPKTAEERARRTQNMMRVCCEVLSNAAAKCGTAEVLNRMANGPHADLLKGRIP